MFYLVVLAFVAVLYGALSRTGMTGVAMTADHRLFIAIACYTVSTVLFRPLLLSMFSYVISVATGLPNIRHSKSLVMGFAISILGLFVAAWSSHEGEKFKQGLAGDAAQAATSKPAPEKGAGRKLHKSREEK